MGMCCLHAQGVLNVATSDLLEVVPASFGDSGRVLVGTGRYHDPVIVDGWSGYQFERNQVGASSISGLLSLGPCFACLGGTAAVCDVFKCCSG